MMEEIRLNFIQNPGSIDLSFCHLHMVTDTDLMQGAAYRHFPVGEDGLVEIAVQFDCIRLYVEKPISDVQEARWQDALYEFCHEWFGKHYPDCSMFHQEPPEEEPPTLAQLHEALGKPDMDALAEVTRWAVNGLAHGHHQTRFAFGTTYQCTHDPQFYAAISGMATELIQRLAVSENLESQLPEKASELAADGWRNRWLGSGKSLPFL